MNDPALGIRILLVAANAGWVAAPTAPNAGKPVVYVGLMEDSPDLAVQCVTTGGKDPEVHLLVDYPTVQVTIRGPVTGGYAAARTVAQSVKDTLLGLFSQVVNGDTWVSVSMMGDIQYLGVDEKRRPLMSLNFRLIVEPSDTVNTNRIAL